MVPEVLAAFRFRRGPPREERPCFEGRRGETRGDERRRPCFEGRLRLVTWPWFEGGGFRKSGAIGSLHRERELFIDNLLVRIHFIIEMIWWTGLAQWEFEFPFPGSLTSTFQTEIKIHTVEHDPFIKSQLASRN